MDFKFIILILSSGLVLTVSSDDNNNGNSIPRVLDAKSMLGSIADSLMSRGHFPTAAGGSQVVSLNLTNLLVLILLKALIFAAGSLGAGTWKGGFARSNIDGEEKLLTDEEILLYLSYLTGSPGCLQNIACHQPQQAKKYVAAGDMLMKASKMLSLTADTNYQYVLEELNTAANVGLETGDCRQFLCGANQNYTE